MSPDQSMERICASFDDDSLLADALSDRGLLTVRRVLAGIAIGYPVDDAYYAAFHLHEAVSLAAADHRSGESDRTGVALLDHMLAQPSDHYLKALWAVVADHGYDRAADHLSWLVEILGARGEVARLANRAGRPVVYRSLPAGLAPLDGADATVEPIEVVTGSFVARDETRR